MQFRYVTSLAIGTLAVLGTALSSAASGDTLANARDASAAYNDPAAALASGYELLTDSSGIACIDMPGAGAMGVHYVKNTLVQSGTLDAARPQALVYEVQPNGKLHLVAIEYVVFQSAWDATHGAPPTLFGQKFTLNPADNRFGLPAFYSLHAWIWKHNPSGTFSPFNPQVRCAPETAGAASTEDASGPSAVADTGASFMGAMPASDAETHTEMGSQQPGDGR